MKTLIIKLGAMGDVLRTTPILRRINGDVTWVVETESIPLLERTNRERPIKIVSIDDCHALRDVENDDFDFVYSLDEEKKGTVFALPFFERAPDRFFGFYSHGERIEYTPTAEEWYRLLPVRWDGKEVDVRAKRDNKRSYQEIIFNLIGMEFNGEEYVFYKDDLPRNTERRVFIERYVGRKWPTKKYRRVEELAELLSKRGFEPFLSSYREDINDYFADISSSEFVIAPDTLTMHIAIALGKKTIALFGPTSPTEIYDYGTLRKIVGELYGSHRTRGYC